MNLGGKNFTNFQNLRVQGTGGDPGALRFVGTSGFESTVSVNATYVDANYQHTLPAKSGLIGISGTFTLNLPAITAGNWASTNVVVSGLRAEDGFVASMMNSSETAVTTDRGQAILLSAKPTNTGINFVFFNPTATATVYGNHVIAYTAFR